MFTLNSQIQSQRGDCGNFDLGLGQVVSSFTCTRCQVSYSYTFSLIGFGPATCRPCWYPLYRTPNTNRFQSANSLPSLLDSNGPILGQNHARTPHSAKLLFVGEVASKLSTGRVPKEQDEIPEVCNYLPANVGQGGPRQATFPPSKGSDIQRLSYLPKMLHRRL